MNQDNKNSLIGMVLILAIMLGWFWYQTPSQAEFDAKKRTEDSLAADKRVKDSLAQVAALPTATGAVDSNYLKQQMASKGDFAQLSVGSEQETVVENNDIKVVFTSKGGRIKSVELKKFKKIVENAQREAVSSPLQLLEDKKNRFEFIFPVNNAQGRISTDDMFFTPSVSGNVVTFTAKLNDNVAIEQRYTLGASYEIGYKIQFKGLNSVLKADAKAVQLNWENYLDKIEKNTSYEKNYSHLRFREEGESADYLSATSTESKELSKIPLNWVSCDNQFFNSTLIATNGAFKSALIGTEMLPDNSEDLKKMVAKVEVPIEKISEGLELKWFVGPNDYQLLKAYKMDLEEIVDYGGSILGSLNRWLIRPLFDFLHGFIGNVAICILLLTLIVKGALYPLSFGMLRSQAKMTALKPEIEKMKAKYKDDQQRIQTEQMKLYSEFGVNPLGGCLPTLLQMPIWMALFRFFPATIDFRQQSFLWATDLSSFEEFVRLPFYIPGYGAHISLFALLWGASLLIFTWYSMKDTDMSGQPAGMKYLQYSTPLIFTFFFNSYAAGLSLYMLFSNLLNIAQTVITKNYVIDKEKVRQELEENKKKPKKTTGFRARLEEAMKQSAELQKQQQEAKNKKK